MTDNNIQKMLCLSTVHVKPDTLQRLQTGDFEWLISYRKEHPSDNEEVYGAFVLVSDITLEAAAEISDVPEDLLHVLRFAHMHSCSWAMFDCDEEEISELPAYRREWDKELFRNPPEYKEEESDE